MDGTGQDMPKTDEEIRTFMCNYLELLDSTMTAQDVAAVTPEFIDSNKELKAYQVTYQELLLFCMQNNVDAGKAIAVIKGVYDFLVKHELIKPVIKTIKGAVATLLQASKAVEVLDPKSENLMPKFNNSSLDKRIPFSDLNTGAPIVVSSFEQLLLIMKACGGNKGDSNFNVKATGTQYAFDDITYTNGYLIDIGTKLTEGVCKDLMEEDKGLLKSDYANKYDDNSFIISEAGATIDDINLAIWPFTKNDKNEYGRFDLKDENGVNYKMLPTMTGYHGLSIGGLVSVGAHGFDSQGSRLNAMQNMVRSITLVTYSKDASKVIVYQVEPKDGIHDPIAFGKYWKEKRILIQDDVMFNTAVVCAGTCGVIYSLTIETTDAKNLEQQRIMTTWDTFKKWYPSLLEMEENGTITQLEYYVSPYTFVSWTDSNSSKSKFSKGEPVMIKLNMPTDEPVTEALRFKNTSQVFAPLNTVVMSASTVVAITNAKDGVFAPLLLPGILMVSLKCVHFFGKIIMSGVDACQLGTAGCSPVNVASMIVEKEYILDAVDEWIKITNEKWPVRIPIKGKVRKVSLYKHPCASPCGVTTCDGAAGYIGMGSGRQSSWIEMPIPDFTYYNAKRNLYTMGVPQEREVKHWQKTADKVYEKLQANPYNGRFHLACYAPFTQDIWSNKDLYPDIDKFIVGYKFFNISKKFCNDFTATGLDQMAEKINLKNSS